MAQGYTKGIPLSTDGTLSANSDLIIPSQKAVKTYVDANSGGGGGGPTFTGYDYEIHVSGADGNDTTGNGDLLTPVQTITYALTLITANRKTIIIHPGTYTESPSITTQYTTLTGPGLIGGNIVISGTVSTSVGCTISGLKMTNLTVTTPSSTGNVNILNCEVSGTLTKSSNADYVVLRLCDLAAASITGSGIVAIFGGNPDFITVNNASANVIVKSAVTIAPVLTAGTLNLVDAVVRAAVTNAVTSAASSVITLANSQFLTSNLGGVAPVVLNGTYSILNCVYDKPSSTLAATSGTGGTANSIDYFQYINADKFIKQGGTSSEYLMADGSVTTGVTASGTSTYIAKFTGASALGNSQIIDNGSRVLIGTATDNTIDKLQINGTIQATNIPIIVTLSADTAINNTQTYADIVPSGGGGQALSFPVVSGTKYYFKFIIRSTNVAAAGGLRLSLNSSVTTSVLAYTSTTAGQFNSTAAIILAQIGFDTVPAATNSGTLSGSIATIEGIITPTSSGVIMGRFAKMGTTATVNQIIKAGSFVEYKILP